MKFYSIASILLIAPLAFAGVIRHELPASFRVVYDKDQVNSLSIGATGLTLQHNENGLIVNSDLGNMEIKNTNKSFVVESVPAPSEDGLVLEPEVVNASGNEKYEVENEKQNTTTPQPTKKFDCMDSPLKDLITKCDGNVRLREYTEEERAKAQEQRNKFREQVEERMKDMRRRMEEAHRIFEESFKNMKSGFANPKLEEA